MTGRDVPDLVVVGSLSSFVFVMLKSRQFLFMFVTSLVTRFVGSAVSNSCDCVE